MVAKPVCAVLFLYPISPVQEEHREKEAKALEGNPTEVNQDIKKVWHIKQRIGNACGTIGILHAMANLPEPSHLIPASSSWFHRFFDACPISLSSTQKADILEGKEEKYVALAAELETSHDAATSDETNQTGRGTLEDKVLTHFVVFVCVDGYLYELDGRKKFPIRHGKTNQYNLLEDSCKVVQKFMNRDPTESRFNIMALAPNVNDF